MLNDGQNYLRVVLVAINEKRADRTVDQARNQSFVFAWTTFALEETTWDLASCVSLFLIVDGQREEILTRLWFLGRNNSRQNDGFAIGCENCTVSLTRDLAGFQNERTAAPFDFNFMGIEHILSSCGDAAQKRLKASPRLADGPRARQREVR
ncbi:hypothetical protein D9M69_504740 [compost metagenome]